MLTRLTTVCGVVAAGAHANAVRDFSCTVALAAVCVFDLRGMGLND